MEDGRPVKQALDWIPEGPCKIGRPHITWNDNTSIKKNIEYSGATREEALLLMTGREDWRSWNAHVLDTGWIKV